MTTVARLIALLMASAIGVLAAMWLLRADLQDPTVGVADLENLYNPVRSGEDVPKSFRQLLPRDAIRPIYDPEFVTAEESTWHSDALVVGLEIDGDARAYPVSFLNRREIVNDHVGNTPVLVTW